MNDDDVRCPVCGRVLILMMPAAIFFRCDGSFRTPHPDGVMFSTFDPRLDPARVERAVRYAKNHARLRAYKTRTNT